MVQLFFYIALFSVGFAHAALIKGKYLDENPAFVCRLQSTVADDPWTCSGTLIAKDKILTAAHCKSAKGEVVDVACGFSLSPEGKNLFTHKLKSLPLEAVAKEDSSNERTISRTDFAIYTLEKEIDITPFPLCENLEECTDKIFYKGMDGVTKTLKPEIECKMAGYGLQNDDTTLGKLKVARVEFKSSILTLNNTSSPHSANFEMLERPYRNFSFDDIDSGEDLNPPMNIPAPGDSGGPLYCNIDNQWLLLGVTSYSGSRALWGAVGTKAFKQYRSNSRKFSQEIMSK